VLQDENVTKKEMIEEMPTNLQKRLVRHLYGNEVSRVPIFAYLETVDDHNEARDNIQEQFLTEIFVSLQYRTYMPNVDIVSFSDAADKLIIFVSGKVDVDFEHHIIKRESMQLQAGDCVGDMAILGDPDWGSSTAFHFPPDETGEHTEIHVHSQDYVVVLELAAEAFQKALEAGSVVTQSAVKAYLERWQEQRLEQLEHLEQDPERRMHVKALRHWHVSVSVSVSVNFR
jgi:hypothetical protein